MGSRHRSAPAKEAIVAPGAITLAAFGREWLDRREIDGSSARSRVRSIQGERSVWTRHVAASALARIAVQSIRVRDVEGFALWLRSREAVQAIRARDGTVHRPTGKPLSYQMQREALRLVRQCLDDAIRLDLIRSNPAKLVRVGRQVSRADLEDDWLRASDIDLLLGCDAISLRDRTVYPCAVGLALRLNDLKSLRVEDVHLDARVPGPHIRVWISKSERWHRVPILPWLDPWLRAHLATLRKDCPWLFPNREGQPYGKHFSFGWPSKRERGRGENGQDLVIPSALERAGVDRKIRSHDLRGTCATHLALGTWGRTWSLHEIQRMLVHSDQRVTERYVRRALDTLSTAAAETPGGPSTLPTVAHDPNSTPLPNPSESFGSTRGTPTRTPERKGGATNRVKSTG